MVGFTGSAAVPSAAVTFGKVAHAAPHPVAGAALVGKPAVDGQDHFVGLGGVIQGLVLVAQPKQLGFAIALADVHAELDEGLIDHILERIRFCAVAGALNGHGRWSLALEEEHQLRFFSSTYIPTRPSRPMP